jgi:hypothetical protein
MLSRAAEVGFWTPPGERVTAIGAALGAHWVAAKAAATNQFWAKSQNWLHVPRHYLNRVSTPR